MADYQRDRLYVAERRHYVALDNPCPIGLRDIQGLVDEIVASDWWAERQPVIRRVEVHASRHSGGRSNVRRTATGVVGVIYLCEWARQRGIVLHELAHLLAGVGHRHGPAFARAYLELVERWDSDQAAHQLRQDFWRYNVEVQEDQHAHRI